MAKSKFPGHGKLPKAYEQSRFDKERPGMKEGSKADIAQDKRGFAAFQKAKGGKARGR